MGAPPLCAVAQACTFSPSPISLRAASVATSALPAGILASSREASCEQAGAVERLEAQGHELLVDLAARRRRDVEVMRRSHNACSAGERGGISSSAIRLSSVATSRPRHSSNGSPEPSVAITGASSPRSTAMLFWSRNCGAAGSGAGFLLLSLALGAAEGIERVPVLGSGRGAQ